MEIVQCLNSENQSCSEGVLQYYKQSCSDGVGEINVFKELSVQRKSKLQKGYFSQELLEACEKIVVLDQQQEMKSVAADDWYSKFESAEEAFSLEDEVMSEGLKLASEKINLLESNWLMEQRLMQLQTAEQVAKLDNEALTKELEMAREHVAKLEHKCQNTSEIVDDLLVKLHDAEHDSKSKNQELSVELKLANERIAKLESRCERGANIIMDNLLRKLHVTEEDVRSQNVSLSTELKLANTNIATLENKCKNVTAVVEYLMMKLQKAEADVKPGQTTEEKQESQNEKVSKNAVTGRRRSRSVEKCNSLVKVVQDVEQPQSANNMLAEELELENDSSTNISKHEKTNVTVDVSMKLRTDEGYQSSENEDVNTQAVSTKDKIPSVERRSKTRSVTVDVVMKLQTTEEQASTQNNPHTQKKEQASNDSITTLERRSDKLSTRWTRPSRRRPNSYWRFIANTLLPWKRFDLLFK